MENIAGNYTKRFSDGDVRSKAAFKFVAGSLESMS